MNMNSYFQYYLVDFFKIPNTHSESFLKDSSHYEKHNSRLLAEFFIGGTKVLLLKYPLYTIIYAPLYLTSTISPFTKYSNKTKDVLLL